MRLLNLNQINLENNIPTLLDGINLNSISESLTGWEAIYLALGIVLFVILIIFLIGCWLEKRDIMKNYDYIDT
uniref:Uncharacterized protein n=1 Tax=Strongyloides venezuelensis TaxID=75913 RepID=A0A0K0EYD6_STRVS